MRLTPGETLWLMRRQFSMTQPMLAESLGTDEKRIRQMEHDRRPFDHYWSDGRVIYALRLVTNRNMSAGQLCALQRRRHSWTLHTLRRMTGRSRVTLIAMEHDRIDPSELLTFWHDQGWWGPLGSAPHNVPLGEYVQDMIIKPE